MQAIVNYESNNSIPSGWINFAISRSSPNGAWQRLERGEIPLDDTFFTGFQQDLHNSTSWDQFKSRKSKSQSVSSPDITPPAFPPLPNVDSRALFWEMMRISRTPDPNIYPALQVLRNKHADKFVLGALSNTIPFPPSHPYSAKHPITEVFDVFISSAEVGLRKPHPEIYELAVRQLDAFDRARGGSGIKVDEVCFLDDIGENCKAARVLGMRTIKVLLGDTGKAVRELEEIAGVRLREEADEKSKL